MYELLKLHMNCNPKYLFGHAEVAGLLANGDVNVSNYTRYQYQCEKRSISYYSEISYNQFMLDTKRTITVKEDSFAMQG